MAEAGVGTPGVEEVTQGDASTKQVAIMTRPQKVGSLGQGPSAARPPGAPCAPRRGLHPPCCVDLGKSGAACHCWVTRVSPLPAHEQLWSTGMGTCPGPKRSGFLGLSLPICKMQVVILA